MNVNGFTARTHLPEQDFLALGLRDIAYVKPVALGEGEEGKIVFAIHTADGAAVGAAESRDIAFAAVRQNGLEPVSIH
jgi:hypothetical protein